MVWIRLISLLRREKISNGSMHSIMFPFWIMEDIALFDNGTAKVKRVDGDNRVSGDNVYSVRLFIRLIQRT